MNLVYSILSQNGTLTRPASRQGSLLDWSHALTVESICAGQVYGGGRIYGGELDLVMGIQT
jgi:hypothetical protein